MSSKQNPKHIIHMDNLTNMTIFVLISLGYDRDPVQTWTEALQ